LGLAGEVYQNAAVAVVKKEAESVTVRDVRVRTREVVIRQAPIEI
jgi:hypothetical protein